MAVPLVAQNRVTFDESRVYFQSSVYYATLGAGVLAATHRRKMPL